MSMENIASHVQLWLVGGATHDGPASDTWRLHVLPEFDGTASGVWLPGLPLEAARSWHAIAPLPAAEVRRQMTHHPPVCIESGQTMILDVPRVIVRQQGW